MPASHDAFETPSPMDSPAWRYLSLSKLLDIVVNRRLAFVRTDVLEDEYEGRMPDRVAERFCRNLRDTNPAYELPQGVGQNIKAPSDEIELFVRSSTLVNSWTKLSAESHALWRIFCGGDDGVAIRSSVRHLHAIASASAHIYLTSVTYKNYAVDEIPFHNVLYQLAHKRHEFEYEHEVRLVWVCWNDEPIGCAKKVQFIDIDPAWIIEEIVVSPFALPGLEDVIRRTLEVIGLPILVRRSRLRASPNLE